MTTNIWKKFTSLLPVPKQLIGTVRNVNSNEQTCFVELLSGAFITAYGVGNVDEVYLIINGELSRQIAIDSDRIFNNETIY